MNNLQNQLLQIEGLVNPISLAGHIFDYESVQELKAKIRLKRKKIRYLLPQKREIFSGVSIIDLEEKALLFKEGVYENREDRIIILPFSLKRSLLDTRIRPKYFYYHPKKFPYEFVSLVSKGEIRKLFFNAMREIYSWLEIEYKHIWYYPLHYRSAFIFRLDTDFARERELKKSYQLLKETGIKGTWFVNTKEHKKLIPLFASWQKEGEDIQLHCFIHQIFPDYKRNYENILQGKEILREGGIAVNGFAAPFGTFNLPLYQVLSDLDFSFSSEFCLSYDDFPFYPVIQEREFKTLQIPIHPICVGRLLEAGFTPYEMFQYYKNYIDWRYKNSLPIFIYDHPHRVASFPELFRRIINYIKEKGDIWITTMAEFYNWWKEREQEGERCALNIIKGERAGFARPDEKETALRPREVVYFPIKSSRIKKGNIKLFIKGILWRMNKYLKGRTR